MAGFQCRRGHDTCSGADQSARNVPTLWRPPGHFTSLRSPPSPLRIQFSAGPYANTTGATGSCILPRPENVNYYNFIGG